MEKNIDLIKVNDYFVESRKAINIALEKERTMLQGLSKKHKFELLAKRKQETNDPEEYEAIVNLEKQLEKEIRFNQPISIVPDEYKEIIRRNVQVEAAEVDKRLKEMKAELKKQVPYLQNVLLPLLYNIHRLKALKIIPIYVNRVLEYEYHEGTGMRLEGFVRSSVPEILSDTTVAVQEIINEIESMRI